MHSFIVAMIVLINISILFALPSPYVYQDGDLQEYNDNDDSEFHHLDKRYQLASWIHKRNPALCDYRLQSRPMPLTSALCAYG
jgi:hypothetical protein